MKGEPCTVCGGTDLNLIDGFYYCVECGTQDVNAQETIVEQTVLADGTFAHATSKKINTVLKDAIEMSGEWHKWHAFNFILKGLVEELIALGAAESLRDRVLHIWTRYMNEFMLKDQMGTLSEVQQKDDKEHKSILFDYEDEIEESIVEVDMSNPEDEPSHDTKKSKTERLKSSVKIMTKGILLSILYIALNQDKSSIQLSHLYKFMNEGRLSIKNCIKFIPKEIDLHSIPHWQNFMKGLKDNDQLTIRQISMTLITVLKLANPVVPHLREIVDNIVKELCLPNDFKNLVFSLMLQVPCDYLAAGSSLRKKGVIRIPDYEGVVMSYILVALKMCFGLDDHYEILLSDVVEKINDEENRLKSYKLGSYSDPSDRLLSFREWSNYLQYRETLLCKYYLPMSRKYNLDIDDQVFIAHLEERPKNKKIPLSDEVTMDILNKILPIEEGHVIPRSEFKASLTPLTHHTETILQFIQDPEIKLLISEDFSQYSLKYACVDLQLIVDGKNIIEGVSTDNKTFNPNIIGTLTCNKTDFTMVYVKHCDNRNWLKTNSPSLEHVTKVNDKDSDHGYDSNTGNCNPDSKDDTVTDANEYQPAELETIEEEREGVSIFDDTFDDVDENGKNEIEIEPEDPNFEFNNSQNYLNVTNTDDDCHRNIYDDSFDIVEFNPETFDREQTIKELILYACQKYKISIPREYNPKEPVKRKNDATGENIIKRKKVERLKRGEKQKEIDKIMTAYYTNMEDDLLNKVSEHIKSFANNFTDLTENQNDDYLTEANFDEDFINDGNKDLNQDRSIETAKNIDGADDVDSSLVEINEPEIDIRDLLPKINPNFDEKTHDPKQLYIRYSQGLEFEDILEIDDPKVIKIIEKKIEECKLNDPLLKVITTEKDLNQLSQKERTNSETTNSEDDEPLIIKNENNDEDDELLGPLIKNLSEIGEFKYWFRHYKSAKIIKNIYLKQKFDNEVQENFPKSFAFVLNKCAAVLDCSACSLYKHMQNLEISLFNVNIKSVYKKSGRGRRSRSKNSDESLLNISDLTSE